MQQLSWVQKSFGRSNSSIDIASTLGSGRKTTSLEDISIFNGNYKDPDGQQNESRNTNSAQECRNASELGGSQRVTSASSLLHSTDDEIEGFNKRLEELEAHFENPRNAAKRLHQLVVGGSSASNQRSFEEDNIGIHNSSGSSLSRDLNDRHYRLIVLKQPEEQHRARYASEGSRGAIKDRSGTSFCTIQLFGYYRPTRVELFAAERNFQHGRPAFVQHSQYKLIPVAGKSSTITPCKQITAEDGSERLEVILRPENQMIGILDCIRIMKMKIKKLPKNRKQRKGGDSAEDQQSNNDDLRQNSVYIVSRAFIPLNDESDCGGRIEVLEAVTEPIHCVKQLASQTVGTPDLLKMSLESSPTHGGQELFLIGRNFDPIDTKILFREYRENGSLGWRAEAIIDRRFLHQCHIVCAVPAYHDIYSDATVSVTVICGNKQSLPMSFKYTACEHEDDDDCSNATNFHGAGTSCRLPLT